MSFVFYYINYDIIYMVMIMKKVLSILLVIIILTGCSIKNPIEKKDKDGFPIGTSNKEDNTKFQVKVIIEKINVRVEPKVSSNKRAIVEKDSIFDVLDYSTDNKYIWFKIKTNNNISGYIASEIKNPYVEMNRELDVVPPELTITNKQLDVETRSKAEEAILKNINVKDDNDGNPKVEYNIDYKGNNNFIFDVQVVVTDSSNNSSKDSFRIRFTGEKHISEDRWLTYKELVNKQKQAKNLCSKYGLSAWKDAIGCILNSDVYDIMIANYTGTTRIGYYDPFTYCNYDKDFKPSLCSDGKGNDGISHDLMPSKFKTLESKWLPKFKNYLDDVKKTTGFDLYELAW